MANLTKKTRGTAMMKWDEELAKYAQEAAGVEAVPSGSFASVRGGVLTIGGQPIEGNKVQVVILDYVYENLYYAGKYDADNRQPPGCYAFGRSEDELSPHDKAEDKQHDQCRGCPQNEWGSAETGRGKACKNIRRLALLSASGLSASSIKEGDVVYMKLPVTSVKGWAYFVKGLAATMNRPPFGVITEIAVRPDPDSQFKITFNPISPLSNELLGAIMERRAEVQDQISFPYAAAAEKPVQIKAPKKRRKF